MKALRTVFLTVTALFALALASLAIMQNRSASAFQELPPEDLQIAVEAPDTQAVETPPPVETPEPSPEPEAEPEPSPEPLEKCEEMLTYRDPATGKEMTYWYFIPEGATVDYPVILFLHGDGFVAHPEFLDSCGIVLDAKKIYGEEYPFIMLVPGTQTKSWELWGIPDTLLSLVDSFFEEKGLTSDKLAITGHSRGAIGTWYLASLYPERFTCAVPVSCPNDMALDFDALASIPIRAFVGGLENDYGQYGPKMKELVEKVNEAGGDAEFTVLDGISHSEMEFATYTQELLEWMISN